MKLWLKARQVIIWKLLLSKAELLYTDDQVLCCLSFVMENCF